MRAALWSLVALGAACAGAPTRPGAVTPADVPALQQQAQQQPRSAAVRFRLAAALTVAGRCDTAVAVARAAQLLAPEDVRGPLVTGACQERAGQHDQAMDTYTRFADAHPRARGVETLRAKAQLTLRTQAEQTARQALAREAELTAVPPEPATLAVLPVTIAGDSAYAPLSRGLAELIVSDLALIRTLRILERIQVGALIDEMKLGQTARADPTTAARVGRLLRAERMVQGVASISSQTPVRLSASVVRGDGTVSPSPVVTGPFRQLLELEKQVVFNLGAQLGIQLTEAERQRILQQGPRNLTAFLAYSDGLAAFDRGDYQAAAQAFGRAAQADPSFQAAQQGQQAAEAAPVVQQAAATGDITTAVRGVTEPTVATEVLSSAAADIAPSVTDAVGTTSTGIGATVTQPTPESRGITTLTQASGLIRIIFRRP